MTRHTAPFARRFALLLAVLAPLVGVAQEAEPLPCSSPGNCVNSASEGFAPLVYAGDAARGLALLKATLAHFPEATLTASEPLRLEVIFRTPLGFKDEVVFVLEPTGQRIQFRSRSLLGRYDFGKNRARMNALVARFQAEARG
ncbi:MAG: hypothetical protein RIS90_2619 [Pseudomonadota bacterium]|jgi:uncharacterized protein (DUF1499 family)